MSHFIVLVDSTNNDIDDLLAPYSEELEVKPYKKPCYCITSGIREKVNEDLKKLFGGDFDTVKRKPYNALAKRLQPDWKEYIKDWQDEEDKLTKKYKKTAKPDPNCEECKGTGKYTTRYNPDSQWDWYSVGGRWTGYFPIKAGATGELGESGVFDNKADPNTADIVLKKDIDIEGAKAKALVEALERWKHRDDPFSEIPHKIKKADYIKAQKEVHPLRPFAFVDNDGVWHQKADMGWWGMTSNEKDLDEWEKEFTDWFNSLPDDTEITAVDCHI
jgi:hypothetical protein